MLDISAVEQTMFIKLETFENDPTDFINRNHASKD